jgi:hypothetical protein
MNPPETSPTFQTPCRHLRCKEMYFRPPGQEDDGHGSGVYWCAKSQEAFGPDGQPVGRQDCCKQRSCYVG